MKTFKQSGEVLPVIAPYDVQRGSGVLIGQLFGLACATVNAGTSVDIMCKGEFVVDKVTTEAWAVGDKIYWNSFSKKFSNVGGGGLLVGLASESAVNPSLLGSLLLTQQPGLVDPVFNAITGESIFSSAVPDSSGVTSEGIADIPDFFFYRRNGLDSGVAVQAALGYKPDVNPYGTINGYLVHPAIVYVPEGFGGYRYWCAYTPMTNNSSIYENPCVITSKDGLSYATPPGLTNPIFPHPGGSAFNSDTHLILSPDRSQLILLYREFASGSPARHRLKVSLSSDGIAWSPAVEIWSCLQSSNNDMASPSLWYDPTLSKWIIVAHRFISVGDASFQKITSSDLLSGWDVSPTVVTCTPPSGRNWWHSYFTRLAGGRVIGIMQDTDTLGAPGHLYFAESLNAGVTWKTSLFDSSTTYYRSAFYAIQRNGIIEPYAVLSRKNTDVIYVQRLGNAACPKDQSSEAEKIGSTAAAYASGFSANTLLGLDLFTRADSASLGNTLDGKTWSQIDAGNPLGVSGNSAANTTDLPCGAVIDVAATRYTLSAQVKTWGTESWIIVGYVDANNYVRIGSYAAATGRVAVQQISGGSVVVNAIPGVYLTDGDIVRICVSGHYCNVFVRGELVYRARNMVQAGVTKVGLLALGASRTAFESLLVQKN